MVVAIILIILVAVVAVEFDARREPTYQGRTVSDLASHLGISGEEPEKAAIIAIGPKGVPYLVKLLYRTDWPYRSEIEPWVLHHRWLNSVVKFGPSAEVCKYGALLALSFLGTNASPALPEILPFLTNQSLIVKEPALVAFAAIAPETSSVQVVVPVLTNLLADPDSETRKLAARSLEALHPPPPETTEALLRLLNDEDEFVRDQAMQYFFSRSNPIVIPVLEDQLRETNTFYLTWTSVWLARYGRAAAGAAPRLRELCDSPSRGIRMAATNALVAITGEAPIAGSPRDGADITFNLPGIPVAMVIGLYEGYVKEKVAPPRRGWPPVLVRVLSPTKLTASEAATLLEDALKEQAQVTIRRGADGALSASVDTQPGQ